MSKPWLKLWCEIRRDAKLQRVEPAWRWVWVGLLTLAQESDAGGRILNVLGEPMDDAEIARECGVSGEVWLAARAYFTRVKSGDTTMLTTLDGAVFVTNHIKRQQVDSTHAARQRKYRSKRSSRDDDSDASRDGASDGTDIQTYRHTEDRRQKTEDRRKNPKLATSSSSLEAGDADRDDDDDVDSVTMAPKDLTLEQFAAWNALQLTAPTFTDAAEFVRKNDAWLIGYWCLAADANPEGVRNAAAFVRAGVEKGVKPRLRGDLTAEWMKQLDRAGDWVGRSNGDGKIKH